MNFIKFIIACCTTLFLLLPHQLFAAQCSAVFPDVIATHGNGNGNSRIDFGYNSRLVNNPDTVLSTLRIDGNSRFDVNSCGSADCTASNNSAEKVSVNFRRGGGSVNYNPPSFQTTTFGIQGSNNYRNIAARANATMQFGDAYNVYFFENLSLSSNNTLNLSAGKTYYFRKFSVGSNVTINVIGSGTATVFVDAGVNFTSPAMINSPSENRSGDVSKLVMHTKGSVTFGSRSTFSGALYAKNITFTSASYLFGVASGERVTLGSRSVLTYDSTVFNADFGEICDFSSPAIAVVNYQFDECKYTGVGNEVLDQLENFNAGASSGVSSSSSSVVNRSLDLSATGTGDWVTIPNDAIDGLNDFSISVWINTSVSKRQQEIFQALGSSASDDEVELYLINSSTLNIKLKDHDENFSIGRNVTNGQWHHLVVTRVQDDICLYVNGSKQDCDDGFPNRSLSVPNSNAVVLGQEQDAYGGRFDSGQSFEGKLDEFIIFDGALTADEITTIYNHQNNGKNYDGSSRDTVSCTSVIANFQFDECAYTGVGNEVIDQLGNYSGTSHNSVNTTDFGQIENALNLASAPHHVQVSIPLPTIYSVSTWFKKPDSNSGSRYFVFGAMENGGDLLLLDRTRSMRWAVYQPDQGNVYGAYSFATLDANWHHMVLVYQGSTTSLYIDGNFIETVNLAPTGTLKYIGTSFDDVNGFNPQGFRAPLDEFIVFNGALSASDITAIYDYQNLSKNYDGSARQASDCKQIHHYEIVHDGGGLTCAAEPITIKACTDSSCSSLSTESVSLDFTLNGVTKSSVTFTGSTDANNPNFSFSHTTPETLILSIAGATLPATNSVQCDGGSCEMTFSEAGYILTLDDHNACTTPNLVIQAVKLSDDGMSCAPAYTGNQPVDVTFNYSSPMTGSRLPILNNIVMEESGIAQRRTLNFNSAATVTLPFQYNDAGRIDIAVGEGSDAGLTSGHVTTIVSPDKLIVSVPEVNSACASADPSDELACKKFKSAGERFTLNIAATCADETIYTPNFELGDIALTVNTIAPDLGNPVILGKRNFNFLEATGEKKDGIIQLTDQTISEVGVFTITATPPVRGYFDKITIPAATSENIGRFVPKHFTVSSVFEGELGNSNGSSFAYTGEMNNLALTEGAISYKNAMEPEILITAQNVGGQPTRNYTGSFMRLDETSFTVPAIALDVSRLEKILDTDVVSNINILASNLSDEGDGAVKYKFSVTDNFIYTRNEKSLINKYIADIDLQIDSIIDSDDVAANDTDSDGSNGILTLDPKGIEIRFGRWNIENTYGPETANLPLPMAVQYWNGSKFAINDLDSLTKYDGSVASNYEKDDTDLSPPLAKGVVNVSDAGPNFNFGLGQLLLSRPTDGSQGQIRIIYTKVPDWLKFNWNGIDEGADSNIFDDDPSGVATFGLYRGNDRIISWREVSN
jgi:MSHA biogenesis protein MshQ